MTLAEKIASAEAALHKLMTGALEAEVRYGDRTVRFAAACWVEVKPGSPSTSGTLNASSATASKGTRVVLAARSPVSTGTLYRFNYSST